MGLDTPVNKPPPDGQITGVFFVSAACFRIDGGSRNASRDTPIEIQWIGWVEPLRNPSQKLQWMGIAEFIIGLIRATRWFHPSCAPV
jgi:hypothetical protein